METGPEASLDPLGRPDPVSVQIAISKSSNNAELPGYPNHLDVTLEHFLAMHEKRRTVVSKAIAAPRAEHPQILPARDKSGRPVDGEKYEPGEKSNDIAHIT